tara:strand:+ start:791 stop:2041 length:1251 start_codon:yes stop_codon:yes gene_type:complete
MEAVKFAVPDQNDDTVQISVVEKEEKPCKVVFATMCKNEEHCILETLASVADHIDSWVVCDTGSSDNTCEIVQKFFDDRNIPGELFQDEWKGFEHNKTLMMQRCQDRADFILHLDADDIFYGNLEDIKTMLRRNVSHYMMTVRRGQSMRYAATQFFNASLKWRIVGVRHTVHSIAENPNDISTIGDDKTLMLENTYVHSRDTGARSADPKKYLIDGQLLAEQFFKTLYDDPDHINARSAFYAGQSYYDYSGGNDVESLEKSLQWYSLYLKLNNGWDEERFESRLKIASILPKLGRPNHEVKYNIDAALRLQPDRAEPRYYYGKYAAECGDFEEAYKYLKPALNCDYEKARAKYRLFVNKSVYGIPIKDELAVACYWTGRGEEGYALVNEVLETPGYENDERILKNKQHFKDKYGYE